MFDTAQQRAAAASAGIGVIFPTYLPTGGPLDKPARSQVAGSYRVELVVLKPKVRISMNKTLSAEDRLRNLETAALGGPNASPTPVTVIDADGQITGRGALIIVKTGVAALTLNAPLIPDDDGSVLRIVDVGGHAHTVTTPTNGINGNKSEA